MKQMITMILLPLLLGMFFQGCGVDHTVYLERETEAPGGGVQEAGTSETEESGRTAADGEASKAKEDTVYYVNVPAFISLRPAAGYLRRLPWPVD